ncbi:hypothetical protein ABB37_01347 [Leptomonas pyrrhocoris]|uniref:Uncharacterized protein n=1 Tax=Leptomonas pyrrhocoris TaxID=157538 RepID=A0A0M9G8L1_LEPPY|nr:hypothetical protein ABB37_01347 [Leptomonas pyrrhocoris]KPA84893.1 hypothetical protein ABB37_01347 [Leptomonas pyrrhocoris]|eukprot:XP_015663332.1 hypothetical protein ABB37_01347 [Leptomonas pyrrhocoris]
MLQKRRLTVQPVDAAHFCGCDNGMVVSFLNGVDHLVIDPAATEQVDTQPLPSRVAAHTYTGAQLVGAAVDTQRECVVEAAVSAAAVVACRVTPLTASKANPTAAYPVRAEGPSKVVFFFGCQRLAEVRVSAGVATTADATADAAACPMQCFRVESGAVPGAFALDIAAFMEGTQTLCACTPQLGKLQTLRFDEQHVCCMGPGRVGRAEVTVVLSNGVAVLCGMLRTPISSDDGEGALACEEQLAPSASSSSSTTSLTAAARRAFAKANEHSSLCVLHTVQLPATPSPTSDTVAAPRRVAWSGASTLWVVYADGAVVAVRCKETNLAHDAPPRHTQQNEESQQSTDSHRVGEPPTETTMSVEHVFHSRLTDKDGHRIPIQNIFTNADPRAPVLHVAFTSGNEGSDGRIARLFYGTVRLSEAAAAAGDGSNPSSLSVQWRLQWMPYDEQLYGVRYERGQFHILTQGCRGGGPLYIALLPRSCPVHTSPSGAAAECAGLAARIMASPENDLANHCRACESLLQELHAATQQLSCEGDAEALLYRLMQAQHALYALLSRQHQSLSVTDLAPSESLPYHLLQRAARLFRQLSAYVLFLRLGIVDTVTKPVQEVLRLEEAAMNSKVAQAQWIALMRDTFRSASVYQSTVAEHAMWHAPTPLCVDLLASQLGLLLSDSSCTMASVLGKMDTLTTEYALFILYYSYQVMGCAGDANAAVPSLSVQQQRRQWRESFLLLFGQSIELNGWAFTCYAVDHHLNPAERCGETADAPARYVLGLAVHHLGAPPFTKLLAPVVNGLAHVAALDVLLHMIPSCLAAYSAAEEAVPITVSMRLLCVAVRAGSHRMIEELYEVMRSSPLLQDLAAQPLAFAALAARDVSGLRGWVEVGSPVAATIERTMQASESIPQRESVLIAYYILLQRYEDALRVCTSATAADPTQAQRLQVVLSYLRSLLSVASAACGGEEACRPAPCAVDSLLPLDSSVHYPWSQTALAAPLLETDFATLSKELKRAALGVKEGGSGVKLVPYSGAGGVAGTSGAAASTVGQGQPHRHHGDSSTPPNAKPPVFRPSTLLLSVERSAGSRGASSPSPGSTVNQAGGF